MQSADPPSSRIPVPARTDREEASEAPKILVRPLSSATQGSHLVETQNVLSRIDPRRPQTRAFGSIDRALPAHRAAANDRLLRIEPLRHRCEDRTQLLVLVAYGQAADDEREDDGD